jgi:hypothetical protein
MSAIAESQVRQETGMEAQSSSKWPNLKLSEEARDLISKIFLGLAFALITAAALAGMAATVIIIYSAVGLGTFLLATALTIAIFTPLLCFSLRNGC